ncbi:MAG: four helix bundle protein [Patescibacteria group bacterium]|jgi:four helix bundle protein
MKYNDLIVYKNSKLLFSVLIKIVRKFPYEGKYLVNQILRAANSIHANIAEGFGRSEAEFKRYLTSALGSCNELISHIEDALMSGYIRKDTAEKLIEKYNIVGKQIYCLRNRWKKYK